MACAPYCLCFACSDEQLASACLDDYDVAQLLVLAGVLDCMQRVGEGGVHVLSLFGCRLGSSVRGQPSHTDQVSAVLILGFALKPEEDALLLRTHQPDLVGFGQQYRRCRGQRPQV